MVGSAQLDIDGETITGERVPVMRGGMWALGAGR
jgi:leucyl aminopeptidase (aminopeptidase T)